MLNSLSENWFNELNTIKISFCEVGLVRHLKHKNKFYIQKNYNGSKKLKISHLRITCTFYIWFISNFIYRLFTVLGLHGRPHGLAVRPLSAMIVRGGVVGRTIR